MGWQISLDTAVLLGMFGSQGVLWGEPKRTDKTMEQMLCWHGRAVGTGMSQEQAVQEQELFLQVKHLLEQQGKLRD